MRSTEFKVSPQSDYYVYTPSALARKLYLYPLLTGYFIYEPSYFIERNHFDNFLIMYIAKGTCTVSAGSPILYRLSRTVCSAGLLPPSQLWQ